MIISSSSVQGSAEAHLPAFLQRGRPLASLRAGVRSRGQSRAAEFLARSGRGRELNSSVLSMMATNVSSDAFAKVKRMIYDLIVRLTEEAASEADEADQVMASEVRR